MTELESKRLKSISDILDKAGVEEVTDLVTIRTEDQLPTVEELIALRQVLVGRYEDTEIKNYEIEDVRSIAEGFTIPEWIKILGKDDKALKTFYKRISKLKLRVKSFEWTGISTVTGEVIRGGAVAQILKNELTRSSKAVTDSSTPPASLDSIEDVKEFIESVRQELAEINRKYEEDQRRLEEEYEKSYDLTLDKLKGVADLVRELKGSLVQLIGEEM